MLTLALIFVATIAVACILGALAGWIVGGLTVRHRRK